jgi:hypothetical protein
VRDSPREARPFYFVSVPHISSFFLILLGSLPQTTHNQVRLAPGLLSLAYGGFRLGREPAPLRCFVHTHALPPACLHVLRRRLTAPGRGGLQRAVYVLISYRATQKHEASTGVVSCAIAPTRRVPSICCTICTFSHVLWILFALRVSCRTSPTHLFKSNCASLVALEHTGISIIGAVPHRIYGKLPHPQLNAPATRLWARPVHTTLWGMPRAPLPSLAVQPQCSHNDRTHWLTLPHVCTVQCPTHTPLFSPCLPNTLRPHPSISVLHVHVVIVPYLDYLGRLAVTSLCASVWHSTSGPEG